jgi:uncharacterized membrane protein
VIGPAIGAAGAAAAFAAMVVTPLAPRGGATRRRAASVVVVGLAASTIDRLRARVGPARAGASVAAITTLGWAVEAIGTRTGRPFGPYGYTGRLRPEVGGVPAVVPLAWFAMAAPARETAHAVLGRRSSPARRVLLGAAALTAWDLFLDPQMVGEGYWRWTRPGRYRGIPLSNYAGWLLVGAAAMVVLEVTAPPDGPADPGLVAEYTGVATMETLGFAWFFRDRLVAVAGGAAMLPLAVAGALRAGRLG